MKNQQYAGRRIGGRCALGNTGGVKTMQRINAGAQALARFNSLYEVSPAQIPARSEVVRSGGVNAALRLQPEFHLPKP